MWLINKLIPIITLEYFFFDVKDKTKYSNINNVNYIISSRKIQHDAVYIKSKLRGRVNYDYDYDYDYDNDYYGKPIYFICG
jgi:hypothetical protein